MRFYDSFVDRLKRNEVPNNSEEKQAEKVEQYMRSLKEKPNARPEQKANLARPTDEG